MIPNFSPYWRAQASVFLFKFADLHGFTFQYPQPIKNLSPGPFLHGANINPHQSPQECCTCESKFNQEKKGLGFYYVNFIGTFPSCPYIQQSVWIQLQLHFTPTHLLAHCYSYLFSGDLRNSKKSPSPLGKRGGRSNSLRHSCIVTLGVNYALKLFKHRPQLLPS